MQRWIGVVWLMVMCTACGPHRPAPPSAQFVTWSHQAASPRRLCVLPFTNETDQPDVGSQVRRSFAGHLSVKRFRDVELHEIDTKLPADWRQLPAQSLGALLGCHALVYGLVSRARRLYLGVYAEIALDGGILLIETRTGRPLVKEAYSTRLRQGGVPFSPFGIVAGTVLTLRHITNAQMLRAVDDLGRNLAAAVPDLPLPPPAPRPGPERSVATRWYQVGRDPFASAARAGQLATALGRTQPFSAIRQALPGREGRDVSRGAGSGR